MPGRRGAAFHEGDRSEYLVTFLLSSVAAVTPITRQEDYGIDFLCALTRKEGPSLYIGKEFAIQAKSDSEKYVLYGGFDRRKRWKEWQIKWLYSQGYPLFIVSVDKNEWRIKLYSLARLWFVR